MAQTQQALSHQRGAELTGCVFSHVGEMCSTCAVHCNSTEISELVFKGRHPFCGSTTCLHVFRMDTPFQVPEVSLLLTTCPYKRHKSVVREWGRDMAVRARNIFPASVTCLDSTYLYRWPHVWKGAFLSDSWVFFSYSPTPSFFYLWPVHLCSVVLLFSFPCNTWESCRGNKLLPAFQHHPAPNAWAPPHIIVILSFKGAAFLCLSIPHHSIQNVGMWGPL